MGQTRPLITVVDDEPDLIENYDAILSDDYDVVGYNSPRQFLDAMKKPGSRKPDLLISDLKMPEMDGIDMVIEAQKLDIYFPFILLTGYLDKASAVKAINAGAFRLLEKPMDVDVLLMNVDHLLIEHEIFKVRKEIRELTSQMRELYTAIRLLMDQYIPAAVLEKLVLDAPDGAPNNKITFDQLMEILETKLESLLQSEKILSELRVNKIRQ